MTSISVSASCAITVGRGSYWTGSLSGGVLNALGVTASNAAQASSVDVS